jgi:flagellar motor switch/type III secretory pathway protein FliN
MATAHILAPPPANQATGHGAAVAPGVASAAAPGLTSGIALEQSLVPSPHPPLESEGIAFAAPVARLPVELDVSVPVRNFRVRNLLALEPSQLIESGWSHGEDVPLAAGEVQLAWSEFEVADTQLAVRVTRLA